MVRWSEAARDIACFAAFTASSFPIGTTNGDLSVIEAAMTA